MLAPTADVLPDDQLYSLLVLSDAGCDLENIHLSSYKQAAGIFCQVVKALSDAEQSCHFEVGACKHVEIYVES